MSLAFLATSTPTGQALAALGGIVVACLSLIGTITVGIATSRATKRAAEQSARTETHKLDAQRLNDLRADLESLRAARVEDRRLYSEETAERRAAYNEELETLKAEIRGIEAQRQLCATRLDELRRWAAVIRNILGEPEVSALLIEQRYEIPPTPRGYGLMDTDPGWRRPPTRRPS